MWRTDWLTNWLTYYLTNFSTSERQKVLRRLQFLNILTSKCAFRHSGVNFFDTEQTKVLQTRVFCNFDSTSIFRTEPRQKCSKPVMFCTFWLANVRFATAPGNFSTSERTKVVQTPHVLYILTCKCAFRHSGVQFLNIWTSKSGPGPSVF